MKSAIEE
jgi:hypothetical protein